MFLRIGIAAVLVGSVIGVVGCDDDNPTKPEPVAVDPNVLSKVRTDWRPASMPYQLQATDYEWSRGTIRWHNPPAVAREDVYQSTETESGEGPSFPFRLIFRPHGYKYVGAPDNRCSDSVAVKSWGGIMMPFRPALKDWTPLFFDMRAKGGRGVLHFDFGLISEDINGNGQFENEDQGNPPNGVLDVNEDTGLDLKLDAAEVNQCGDPVNSITNPDPAGDNWWFEYQGKGARASNHPPIPEWLWTPALQAQVDDVGNWMHYEWLNGTEGNINDPASQGAPDREAVGPTPNEINRYFSITVDLDSTSPYVIPASGRTGWWTYRVPLCACPGIVDTVGDMGSSQHLSWSDVRQVRIWFEQDTTGVDSLLSMDSIWIAHWRLVDELSDLYTNPK